MIREENTLMSLPVITISNPEQLLANSNYRDRCVESLIEIVLDVDSYLKIVRSYLVYLTFLGFATVMNRKRDISHEQR